MTAPAQLLEPLTNPSTATPDAVAAAVHGFKAQAEAAGSDQSALGNCVWNAFHALFAAAGRTPPEHQGPLVEFVVQLRKTTVTDSDGKPLKCDDAHGVEAGQVWRDLPSFGWVAREFLNFDAYDPEATEEDRAEWESHTAFMARLTALDTNIDMSLYGLWMMREAFEEEDKSTMGFTKTGISKSAVRVAALWIRYAGERLRKLAAEGLTYPERLGVSKGKYSEREWRGFNEERWQVWREGFKDAQAQIGEDADELVQAAVDIMERL